MVRHYNVNMGGVDLANRMIAAYRSSHTTKKWPVRGFEDFMDCAAVKCWIQSILDCKELGTPQKNILDLIEFKNRIDECLIKGINHFSWNSIRLRRWGITAKITKEVCLDMFHCHPKTKQNQKLCTCQMLLTSKIPKYAEILGVINAQRSKLQTFFVCS